MYQKPYSYCSELNQLSYPYIIIYPIHSDSIPWYHPIYRWTNNGYGHHFPVLRCSSVPSSESLPRLPHLRLETFDRHQLLRQLLLPALKIFQLDAKRVPRRQNKGERTVSPAPVRSWNIMCIYIYILYLIYIYMYISTPCNYVYNVYIYYTLDLLH